MKNYNTFLTLLAILLTTSITFAQNVGIGESAPVQKLQVNDDATGTLTTIRVEDLGTGKDGDYGTTAKQTNNTSSALTAPLSGEAKVVYADGNGDLHIRHIYGDNIQNVNPTTDFDLANLSTQDVPGMTITFTPRHSVVYVTYSMSGASYLDANAGDVGGYVTGRLLKDNVLVNGTASSIVQGYDPGVQTFAAWGLSANMIPISVTPGISTTLKVQYFSNAPTGETFFCNPTQYPTFCHRNITILD